MDENFLKNIAIQHNLSDDEYEFMLFKLLETTYDARCSDLIRKELDKIAEKEDFENLAKKFDKLIKENKN